MRHPWRIMARLQTAPMGTTIIPRTRARLTGITVLNGSPEASFWVLARGFTATMADVASTAGDTATGAVSVVNVTSAVEKDSVAKDSLVEVSKVGAALTVEATAANLLAAVPTGAAVDLTVAAAKAAGSTVVAVDLTAAVDTAVADIDRL